MEVGCLIKGIVRKSRIFLRVEISLWIRCTMETAHNQR